MSRDLPPRPVGRVYGSLVLIALMAMLPLGGAWVLAQGDGWSRLSAVLMVVVVVLALGLLVGGALAERRGQLRARSGVGGTELPSSAAMLGCLLGLGAGVVLFAVSFLAAGLAGERSGAVSAGVMLVAVVVLAVPIGAGLAGGRFQRGGMLLTPDAVRQSSYIASSAIAWGDLREVELVADPGRRLVLRADAADGVRRDGLPRSMAERQVGGPTVGAHEVSVPLAFMGSDGSLVAAAIDFYRRTPAVRGELGTAAALARMERRDFG